MTREYHKQTEHPEDEIGIIIGRDSRTSDETWMQITDREGNFIIYLDDRETRNLAAQIQKIINKDFVEIGL